jgi:hypothetical protein
MYRPTAAVSACFPEATVPVLWSNFPCQDKKMRSFPVLFTLFLLTGCVLPGQKTVDTPAVIEPTVVFRPSDSAYLLSCVSELRDLKSRDFQKHYREVSNRLAGGSDRDILQFVCLSLNRRADYKQFKQGEKVFRKYLGDHPGATEDMKGVLVLLQDLDRLLGSRRAAYRKLLDERDRLAAETEVLKRQHQQDTGRIENLQRQIEQLKNIESIIKSREHQK